jgi:hypothetical protein
MHRGKAKKVTPSFDPKCLGAYRTLSSVGPDHFPARTVHFGLNVAAITEALTRRATTL